MAKKPGWHVDLYERVAYRKKPSKRFRFVAPMHTMTTHQAAIDFATRMQRPGTLLVVRKAGTKAPKSYLVIGIDE